ncbi:ATP-grasp domain-containing protein [Virgibacillus alimentarius]|uniref:ATP-grasp domain-containing protein n=1 Tax=Virgibacillus alimentarius TaxID=698769 RepID=UPI0004930A42|nr:ATP-grasp domain-containing protein [Virgibacillus alimentarius]
MEHILLIGFGIQGADYVYQAKQLGFYVSAIEHKSNKSFDPVVNASKEVDNMIWVNNLKKEHIIRLSLNINSHKPLDGIIGFSEPHIYTSVIIAETLSLPSPGLYATIVSQNKALQRDIFSKSNYIPIPKYKLIHKEADELDFQGELIAKPVNSTGSKGVKQLSNRLELENYLKEQGREFPVLVEEFIDGKEYSIETLVENGEIIFENITFKETTDPPYCVEKSHTVPANIPKHVKDKILVVNRNVINTIKMNTGVVHLEVKYHNDIYVLEYAVRTPGDYILDCIELAYGFNVFKEIIKLNTRCSSLSINNIPNNVGYVEWVTPSSGIIKKIEGIEKISQLPEIKNIVMFVNEKDTIGKITSSSSRAGFFISEFKDFNHKENKIKEIKELLTIETTSPK